MSEEVKEILDDYLSMNDIDYFEMKGIYFKEEINKIKDYITNLQKENEELKSKNDILEFRMKQNDKMVICERYRILKQRDNYKQRIDKAIAVINTQMKNLSKDEAGNLRIIKFNLIKGSCTPLDLTTEEDYKY